MLCSAFGVRISFGFRVSAIGFAGLPSPRRSNKHILHIPLPLVPEPSICGVHERQRYVWSRARQFGFS